MGSEMMSREKEIEAFVHARINSIQKDYLSSNSKSRGARNLAVLRHAMMTPIGSDADAWPLEFEGLPVELAGRGPEPSCGEVAVHDALTLYAFHQQGQSIPMHVRGDNCGFGNAVRQLIRILRQGKCLDDFGPLLLRSPWRKLAIMQGSSFSSCVLRRFPLIMRSSQRSFISCRILTRRTRFGLRGGVDSLSPAALMRTVLTSNNYR